MPPVLQNGAVPVGRLLTAMAVATGLFLGSLDARAESSETKPSTKPLAPTEVYRRVAPSVVVVEARVPDGVSQGSGVVVGDRQIATNHHVVEGSIGFVLVHQGPRTWRAEVERTDKDHDLALLTVLLRRDETFVLPAAHLRKVGSVRVGEGVYAVGAPQGLERTLSEGLVSGILQLDGSDRVIQTTAASSRGSSGGGLFDSRGVRLGITTMYLKEGQNLNFAIPADRLEALQNSSSTSTGHYTLSPAIQPASQSTAMPSRPPDLPTALRHVRAVIISASSDGPVATEGKIDSNWIVARATKALREAGIGVFVSQAEAQKSTAYALSLVIDVSSMRIEGTAFYPWTLSLTLGDTSDFSDGSNGIVVTWQSGTYGFGGSQVVVDQVAGQLDRQISKFAIDALKERSKPVQ